jgi:hypothetical protein
MFTERQKISSAFAPGPGLTASDDAKAGRLALREIEIASMTGGCAECDLARRRREQAA